MSQVLPSNEIDFEVSTRDGKYTARFFKPSGWEVLRHGEPWISRDELVSGIAGVNAWHAFIWELAELKSGIGDGHGPTAIELARETLAAAKLPRVGGGSALAPIPADVVEKLIALAITRDRNACPIDPDPIAERVLTNALEHDINIGDHNDEEWQRLKGYIVAGVRNAQARGARIAKPISEDDYAEASRAAHETFMAVLRDKGLWAG